MTQLGIHTLVSGSMPINPVAELFSGAAITVSADVPEAAKLLRIGKNQAYEPVREGRLGNGAKMPHISVRHFVLHF